MNRLMQCRRSRSLIVGVTVAVAVELAHGSSPMAAKPAFSLESVQACGAGVEFRVLTAFDRSPPLINDQRIPIEVEEDVFIGDHKSRISIQYEGGTIEDRQAAVRPAPGGESSGLALAFDIRRPYGSSSTPKGRVQLNLYRLKGAQSIYMRKQVYLHPDFIKLEHFSGTFTWLTISEWWNNAPWLTNATFPFRITLDLVKSDPYEGSPLHFAVKSQTYDQVARRWNKPVWTSINKNVQVPVDEWFWLEYSIAEGNGETGRFQINLYKGPSSMITVFDIQNFTHHPDDPSPDGFTEINPIKLYTSASVINFLREKASSLRVYWNNVDLKGCLHPVGRWKSESPRGG